ncbi:HAMP domain-containing sensor histidine kinase [Actinoplanes sp. N902-109]|uniref:sensor histidine kinase n=1 Tax=Actinoplanes sp. (strain N902-109) TaxID=649831 RepID=UPI0003A82122|nr:HAMP domain-containing sensor histidine kinase [Actinoplanes sp. N902-109]
MPTWSTVMRLSVRRRPDPALVLLRSMCHELRPPVSTLTALVRALEEQPSAERRDELARLAADHASHVEAVLSQAAATANGLTSSAECPVPLQHVIPVVAATVPAQRLRIAVTPEAVSWPVAARPVRQILLNLLRNADEHSPGQIRLTATVHRRRLRLTIADEGAPTPDLLRALRRRTPPPDRNGLGLWVVRHMVAGQNGTIEARALRPRGLGVRVCLPRPRC